MYKIICFLDDVLDRILALAFTVLLLVGIYFIYDTAFIYYHASSARVEFYRPGTNSSELEGVRPFTDDYAAWLKIDDTKIDFPVMQGETNSKYLNMDPYGDYLLAGSIFLDFRNARDFSDSYSLIYGHHMANGVMFGALDSFYDKEYFYKHLKGSLTTEKTEYTLRVFALLTVEVNEDRLFDPQGSEVAIQVARENSVYYMDPENDHVIALSTCKDPGSTTRTVVLATITEKERR